jgi:hypothetical protein
MIRPAVIGFLALTASSPLAAAPSEARISADEAVAVQLAADRGALIYAYDRAAWHGTDDLKAKLPDFPTKVGGWIVDGPADAARLVFYDKDKSDPNAVYVADFRGRELVSGRLLGAADDRSLSPIRKAMVAARSAAAAALTAGKGKHCKPEAFNSVVLPPAAPGGDTLVYFLTPQTDARAIPMGGHYRIDVAPEGPAGKPRAFTKSCMEMPFENEKGERPEALVITHLLDRTPTEIHVFSSLALGLPIFVATTEGNRLWSVEGTRIRLVGKVPR